MLPQVHTSLTALPGCWCPFFAVLFKVHLLDSPAVGCAPSVFLCEKCR